MSFANLRRRNVQMIRSVLFAICALFLAGVLFIVTVTKLDGTYSRQRANAASAVSRVRAIVTLQEQYAA